MLMYNKCILCCLLESGDLGGGEAGVHSERGEDQSWLETLDRGRQSLSGGLIISVIVIRLEPGLT